MTHHFFYVQALLIKETELKTNFPIDKRTPSIRPRERLIKNQLLFQSEWVSASFDLVRILIEQNTHTYSLFNYTDSALIILGTQLDSQTEKKEFGKCKKKNHSHFRFLFLITSISLPLYHFRSHLSFN